MKQIMKAVLPISLIVGVFAIAVAIITGSTNFEGSALSIESINYGSYTWTYYKFHTDIYLLSLQRSLNLNQFKNVLPDMPQLATLPNWANIVDILRFGFNTLFIYLANWIIYSMNWTLLAPLKLILYPFAIILSILGVDTNNIDVLKFLNTLWNLGIPLIPYI